MNYYLKFKSAYSILTSQAIHWRETDGYNHAGSENLWSKICLKSKCLAVQTWLS